MSNSIHRQLATDNETLIKIGVAAKTASMGKSAQLFDSIADAGVKTLITASLVTGIPIGIMSHLIGNKIKSRRLKEKEMDARIEHYRNATQSIEDALAARGAQY